MRKIKKTVKVATLEVLAYDKLNKTEVTMHVDVPEYFDKPQLAPELVILSITTLSEREATYTMTAEQFFTHATIE